MTKILTVLTALFLSTACDFENPPKNSDSDPASESEADTLTEDDVDTATEEEGSEDSESSEEGDEDCRAAYSMGERIGCVRGEISSFVSVIDSKGRHVTIDKNTGGITSIEDYDLVYASPLCTGPQYHKTACESLADPVKLRALNSFAVELRPAIFDTSEMHYRVPNNNVCGDYPGQDTGCYRVVVPVTDATHFRTPITVE